MFVVSFSKEHEGERHRYRAVVSEALRRGRERIEADPKLALRRFTITVRTEKQGVLFQVAYVPTSCALH